MKSGFARFAKYIEQENLPRKVAAQVVLMLVAWAAARPGVIRRTCDDLGQRW